MTYDFMTIDVMTYDIIDIMKYDVLWHEVIFYDVINEENLILKTVPGPSLHNQQMKTAHNSAISSRIQLR